MADLPPNLPSGAVPPPKKETGKVQPKKETVRINLPPKPSAAPTIKLPTLPPGGPTGAPSPMPAAAPVAMAAAPRATIAAPTAPHTASSPAAARPTAQQSRPVVAAAPQVPTINGLDKGLILAGAVLSLAAVGIVVWIYFALDGTVKNFVS